MIAGVFIVLLGMGQKRAENTRFALMCQEI